MLVTRRSHLTGRINSLEIPITEEELIAAQIDDRCIQDIFPQLTSMQREFLLTGSTQEEWDLIFPPEKKNVH